MNPSIPIFNFFETKFEKSFLSSPAFAVTTSVINNKTVYTCHSIQELFLSNDIINITDITFVLADGRSSSDLDAPGWYLRNFLAFVSIYVQEKCLSNSAVNYITANNMFSVICWRNKQGKLM